MTGVRSASARPIRNRIAAVVALTACLVGTGLVLLARAWEPRDIGRGNVIYWLAIPDIAKAVPVLEACAAPRYSLSRQDGLRPRLAEVRYATRLPTDDLLLRYRSVLDGAGCEMDLRPDMLSARSCAAPFDHADLEVMVGSAETETGCGTITVSIVGG